MCYIKYIPVYFLLTVSLVACSKESSYETYKNQDIGLIFTYPATWREMSNTFTRESLDQAKDKTDISPDAIDAAKEYLPNIILKLARPMKINGVNHNPNINIFAIKLGKEDWAQLNLDTILQEQVDDIKNSMPNAKVTMHALPLPDYPTIHNYASELTLKDRVVNQYQYFYVHPPYFIQMVLSYSHPSLDDEVKQIIRSMKITSDKNYQAKPVQKKRQ